MQDVKKAFQSAKKELDEESRRKLIDEMKGYIKNTLQAIEDKKSEIAENQQEMKALKADLTDLEEGRLSKIKERQDKDPVAKRVSVINITYIINNYPWIVPYFQPVYPIYYEQHYALGMATITNGNGGGGCSSFGTSGTNAIGSGSGGGSNGFNQLKSLPITNTLAYCGSDISGTYTVNSNGGVKAFYIEG